MLSTLSYTQNLLEVMLVEDEPEEPILTIREPDKPKVTWTLVEDIKDLY